MREIKFRVWYSDRKSSFYIYGSQALRLMGYFGQEGYSFEQYTGIKDKNGVDVYEGDIIQVRSHLYKDHVGAIIWSQNEAGFCISDNTNKFNIPRPLGIQMDGFLSYEVIGNVHQNSDLLVNDTDRISPDDIGNDIHEFLNEGDK